FKYFICEEIIGFACLKVIITSSLTGSFILDVIHKYGYKIIEYVQGGRIGKLNIIKDLKDAIYISKFELIPLLKIATKKPYNL
ncbi:MAG: hypothetical protein ACE5J9_08090, partial [Methanosarcinales archaeon]